MAAVGLRLAVNLDRFRARLFIFLPVAFLPLGTGVFVTAPEDFDGV